MKKDIISIQRIMKKIQSIVSLESFWKTLAKSDLKSQQRLRLFKIYTFFALFVYAGVLYQNYVADNSNLLFICLISALFIAIFINYFGLPIHRKPEKAYIIQLALGFAVLHVISYVEGGIRNSGMFYLATMILTAYMLLGKRSGEIMAGISIVNLIYFYFVSLNTNWVNYSLIGTEPGMIDLDFLITGILSTMVLTAQANYIEKSKNAITEDIKLKRDELALKNTSLLNTQKELERKNKELGKKNKELEQFAHVASHDLQEPLNTASSFAGLIQAQYKGQLDERADKYLDYLVDSSDRMKILIKDLLDFSRIGMKADFEKVDCNKVLKDVLADLDTTINNSSVEIKSGDLPVINGYPTEIKQLFKNLISNAIKFRDKNVCPEINISVLKMKGYWEFAFADNGIGIDKQHNEKIFIIFQRLHNRTEYKGSGIGLSHCKKIVELHSGEIWVESKPGEGSTFYFTLQEKSKSSMYRQVPHDILV